MLLPLAVLGADPIAPNDLLSIVQDTRAQPEELDWIPFARAADGRLSAWPWSAAVFL